MDFIYYIFYIPIGVWFLLIISILLLLKRNFHTRSKLISKIIYFVYLSLSASLMYSVIEGFPYSCPCGQCGNLIYIHGLEAIVYFFVDTVKI